MVRVVFLETGTEVEVASKVAEILEGRGKVKIVTESPAEVQIEKPSRATRRQSVDGARLDEKV